VIDEPLTDHSRADLVSEALTQPNERWARAVVPWVIGRQLWLDRQSDDWPLYPL